MTIPLCRAHLGEEEFAAVADVLRSGWLTHGPKNTEFEELFAEYHGTRHAIAMNSCTSALFLAVRAADIRGKVMLPSFTFVASANAIVTAGAQPLFVDICQHDCNMNAALLEDALTPDTEAVMAVHFAGQCCNMADIDSFAKRHGLAVIEDSAETIGGTFGGLKSGSWGTGCFSFFPTKNITTGEGGMLTTNDDALARRVRTLVGHGIDKSTHQRASSARSWERMAVEPGYNFRMSNILAALGVEQVKKLDRMNELRRAHSFRLISLMSDIGEVELPVENPGCTHVFQMFTIKVKQGDRDGLVEHLKKRGIEASVHFFPPVHRHPAYGKFKDAHLPVTDRVARSIVTLPMFPGMSDGDVDSIAAAVREYFTGKSA